MRGFAGFDETQPFKGAMVFDQLHPRLQFKPGQAKGAGAMLGDFHQLSCKPLTAKSFVGRQFAKVKRIWLERQHHAGAGRRAKRSDLTRFARLGQCLTREPMHGGGRIDPGLHIGEIFTDQGQDVTEIWIVRGVAFRREHALI